MVVGVVLVVGKLESQEDVYGFGSSYSVECAMGVCERLKFPNFTSQSLLLVVNPMS